MGAKAFVEVPNTPHKVRKTLAQWHKVRRDFEPDFKGPTAPHLGIERRALLTATQYHDAMTEAGLHTQHGRKQQHV